MHDLSRLEKVELLTISLILVLGLAIHILQTVL